MSKLVYLTVLHQPSRIRGSANVQWTIPKSGLSYKKSPRKKGVVVLPHRLGMNPQATWLRRINPASNRLDVVVIKHTRLYRSIL